MDSVDDSDDAADPSTVRICAWMFAVGFAASEMRPIPEGKGFWLAMGLPRLVRVVVDWPSDHVYRGDLVAVYGLLQTIDDWFELHADDLRRFPIRQPKLRLATGPITALFVRRGKSPRRATDKKP